VQFHLTAQLLHIVLQLVEARGHFDQRAAVEQTLDACQPTLNGGRLADNRRCGWSPTRANHRGQVLGQRAPGAERQERDQNMVAYSHGINDQRAG